MRTTTKIKSILKDCTIQMVMHENESIDLFVIHKVVGTAVYTGKTLSLLIDKAHRGTKKTVNKFNRLKNI